MSAPPLFTPYSLDAAIELTRQSGRILVVDVMAQWCGPCREMDRTTWRDDRVIAWVREHATALQLDADREPDAAARLRVDAFPTVIAMRNGNEVARAVGYRGPDDMLDWL